MRESKSSQKGANFTRNIKTLHCNATEKWRQCPSHHNSSRMRRCCYYAGVLIYEVQRLGDLKSRIFMPSFVKIGQLFKHMEWV